MIAAKRANARKSTGPRRKARVTLNALKHRGYAGRLFVGIRIHILKMGIRLHFWVCSRRMVWPRLGHWDFPGPQEGRVSN